MLSQESIRESCSGLHERSEDNHYHGGDADLHDVSHHSARYGERDWEAAQLEDLSVESQGHCVVQGGVHNGCKSDDRTAMGPRKA